MNVIDSSVWIAHLRKLDTVETRKLEHIMRVSVDTVLIGDIVLLEILRGARDDAQARRLERELRCFSIVPMLDADLAVSAASNYRTLRNLGITVRKAVDLIIGTFCIGHGHCLLHADRDFEPMQRHLGLQVA